MAEIYGTDFVYCFIPFIKLNYTARFLFVLDVFMGYWVSINIKYRDMFIER